MESNPHHSELPVQHGVLFWLPSSCLTLSPSLFFQHRGEMRNLKVVFQAQPNGLWKLRAAYKTSSPSVKYSDVCWDKLYDMWVAFSSPVHLISFLPDSSEHKKKQAFLRTFQMSPRFIRFWLGERITSLCHFWRLNWRAYSWNFPRLFRKAHEFTLRQDTCSLTSKVPLPLPSYLSSVHWGALVAGSLIILPFRHGASVCSGVCSGERWLLLQVTETPYLHPNIGFLTQGRVRLISLEFG